MPKLGAYKRIMDTVCFLYPNENDAKEGKRFGGTGVFVAVESAKFDWPDQFFHLHVVTNWHVMKSASVIRVNRRDGAAPDIFPLDDVQWTFLAGQDDLAISPPLPINPHLHCVEALGIQAILSDEEQKLEDINAAEDVFMLGRFVDYDGIETNVPAFRFGHISILHAHVKQSTGFKGRSIAIDMRSRTGFSGSPIFVYRTPSSILDAKADLATSWHYVKLLGVLWGHFNEEGDELVDQSRATALAVSAGQHTSAFGGMSLAVPAQSIINLLQHPTLVQQREEMEQGFQDGPAPSSVKPLLFENNRPLGGGSERGRLLDEAKAFAIMLG